MSFRALPAHLIPLHPLSDRVSSSFSFYVPFSHIVTTSLTHTLSQPQTHIPTLSALVNCLYFVYVPVYFPLRLHIIFHCINVQGFKRLCSHNFAHIWRIMLTISTCLMYSKRQIFTRRGDFCACAAMPIEGEHFVQRRGVCTCIHR